MQKGGLPLHQAMFALCGCHASTEQCCVADRRSYGSFYVCVCCVVPQPKRAHLIQAHARAARAHMIYMLAFTLRCVRACVRVRAAPHLHFFVSRVVDVFSSYFPSGNVKVKTFYAVG